MHFLVDLVLGCLSQLQAERHVVVHGHMRIQSVVLEYHCDVAVLGLHIVYQLIVNVEFTGRNVLQTCDHTKGGRLAAAGRAYENDKFLIINFQVKILDSYKSVGIFLGYVFQ